MAKDDYFVLAYKILAHLYACLKQGEQPDSEYLNYGTKAFPIGESYWNYIIQHLYEDGLVEGIHLIPMMGNTGYGIKGMRDIQITPRGIEYLSENSMMEKAKRTLKELKEIIPGL